MGPTSGTSDARESVPSVLSRAHHDIVELLQFVETCSDGFGHSATAAELLQLRIEAQKLGRKPLPDEETLSAERAKACEVAAFARLQQQDGFNYLYCLASVRLWGILEAGVDDIAGCMLLAPGNCKDQAMLRKLKGPLLDFVGASPEEQAEHLTECLKSSVQATQKTGIGRFEDLLDPLGLGGQADTNVKRILLEVQQVRNLVAHRSGVVDTRFLSACPYASAQKGQRIRVSLGAFATYVVASRWYVDELHRRWAVLTGVPDRNAERRAELARTLSAYLELCTSVGPAGKVAKTCGST